MVGGKHGLMHWHWCLINSYEQCGGSCNVFYAPHNQHFDFQNIPSKENLNYKILIDTEIIPK